MEKLTKHFENIIKKNWDQPALTDYQIATETYGELAQKIEMLHITWKEAGLQVGDKIAINARSCSHWGEVFMAALSGGYISVQLYNAFLPADVEQLVNHSDTKILFTEQKSYKDMNPAHMPNVLAIINTDTYEVLHAQPAFLAAQEKAASIFQERYPNGFTAADVAYHHRDMDEVCAIMYTSGSTGNPKGVMLTARNFSWNVDEFRKLLPYYPGENYVSILPYAHIFGLSCDLVTPMCTGMHSIILGRLPIPALLEEMMRTYSPKIFLAVPLVLSKFVEHTVGAEMHSEEGKRMLENYEQYPEFCTALRKKVLEALGGKIEAFATGGAAIPPAIERLLAFQINMPFITGYGMSECAPLISLGEVGKYKAKSCGEVPQSIEVRIDSADAKHIPGEVQVKGDCVFAGYYKNEQATAEAFTEDGWFKTGDMGTMDEDRTLFLVGRCKHMLLSSNGQNIYPEEIEVLLNAQPYVAESVVVQREHILHALIVPNMTLMDQDNLDAQTLQSIMENNIQNLNTKLPQYSLVSSFELRFEPFSKTPKGSIRRFMYS
ncbi:MAG: AMP-binding protein [Paludibacteraceae bacterium]|nr:AMP-binding protein [Paludibacteraceae bacterium]MBO5014083.1 AMP-binding protein [Paludibacteraceae bacterium]MBP3576273.1 AMP-binding protein [Paludibacteraceae bacterium]